MQPTVMRDFVAHITVLWDPHIAHVDALLPFHERAAGISALVWYGHLPFSSFSCGS